MTSFMTNSWDIYDKGTDSWFAHKNPMLTPDIVKFVALDSRASDHPQGCLEQDVLCWSIQSCLSANEIALCWSGPMVVLDEMALSMLDQSLSTKLMMWVNETKE